MKTEKVISTWAKLLLASLDRKTEKEQKEMLKNLLHLLTKQRKQHLMPSILKRLEKNYLKAKKIELTLAREQSMELLEKIRKKMPSVFKGDSVVETSLETDLIGGFRLKTNNILVKASVKDLLDDLRGR